MIEKILDGWSQLTEEEKLDILDKISERENKNDN